MTGCSRFSTSLYVLMLPVNIWTDRERERERTSVSKLLFNDWSDRCTSLPWIFFQRSHLAKPGRQYSTTYASVYSWPWPLPNLPWVRSAVITCICNKSICKYSLRPRETMCFGHQAPPLLSIFNLISLRERKKQILWFNFSFQCSKCITYLACCGPTFPGSCALLAVIWKSLIAPDSIPNGTMHSPKDENSTSWLIYCYQNLVQGLSPVKPYTKG